MSFLKLWKTSSRHKKLCEELALATSLRDLGDLPDTMEDSDSECATFAVKHLGDTLITPGDDSAVHSKCQMTSEAVKSVIAAAKGNDNKLARVNLTVSPKGIEIIDRVTSETLQQISIYRISYCSADAAHNNVFAFISSPSTADANEDQVSDPTSADRFGDGPLTCHVFVCSKRKIAQSIALTVAKSFERAFEIWKSISHRRLVSETRQKPRLGYSPTPRPDALVFDGAGEQDEEEEQEQEEKVMNLLIDLNADLTDIRKSYLQNTWVSFEETEHLMSTLQKNAICL